jgi:hypothetical protein
MEIWVFTFLFCFSIMADTYVARCDAMSKADLGITGPDVSSAIRDYRTGLTAMKILLHL